MLLVNEIYLGKKTYNENLKDEIEDDLKYLNDIWTEIILPNSSIEFGKLKSYFNVVIRDLVTDKIKLDRDLGHSPIGPQLDSKVVKIMLFGAGLIKNVELIDYIYEETKYFYPQYFYDNEIVNAYLMADEVDKAIAVIDYLMHLYKTKKIIGYLYKINKYNTISDERFIKKFESRRIECIAELLFTGEGITIENVNLKLFNEVYKRLEKKIAERDGKNE